VKNSVDLAGTFEAAFEEDGPSLVVIPIDYRENALLTKKLGDITCKI
jgi:acetolactate synthase-1/2/3 large subunit